MGFFNIFKKNKKPTITVQKTPTQDIVIDHTQIAGDLDRQFQNKVHELQVLSTRCYKSANGLLPHEILVLYYAPKYSAATTDFPRFWLTRYGIDDVRKELNSLHKRGFITEAISFEALSGLKLAQLKEVAAQNSISASGTKNDIINRLLNQVPASTLSSCIPALNYSLTDLGKSELAANEYVSYFHKHIVYEINIFEANLSMGKANFPVKQYSDWLWGTHNANYLKHSVQKRVGLIANTYHKMYYQLKLEGRYVDAYFMLLRRIAIEINHNLKYRDIPEQAFLDYWVKGAKELALLLGYSDEKVESDFVKTVLEDHDPLNYEIFTPAQAGAMLAAQMNNDVPVIMAIAESVIAQNK